MTNAKHTTTEPLDVHDRRESAMTLADPVDEDDTVRIWDDEQSKWRDCEVLDGGCTIALPDGWEPAPEGEAVTNDPHLVVSDHGTDRDPGIEPGAQVDLRQEYINVERQIAEQQAEGQTVDKWLEVRRACIRQKLIDEGQDVPDVGKLFDDDGGLWFDVAVERTQQAQKLREAYNDAREKIRRLEEKLGERGAAE